MYFFKCLKPHIYMLFTTVYLPLNFNGSSVILPTANETEFTGLAKGKLESSSMPA